MGFETFYSLMKTTPKLKFYKHLEGLKVRAEFSDCGKFRYLLEIANEKKKKGQKVCTIMVNPSVANVKQADKSVQFLEKLIFEKPSPYFKNVSSFFVVNLFSFIQTRDFKGSPEQVGAKNDHYLERAIAVADIVLIAWGKSNTHQERKECVLELLQRYTDKKVYTTKKHPSRGHYNSFISEFQS